MLDTGEQMKSDCAFKELIYFPPGRLVMFRYISHNLECQKNQRREKGESKFVEIEARLKVEETL